MVMKSWRVFLIFFFFLLCIQKWNPFSEIARFPILFVWGIPVLKTAKVSSIGRFFFDRPVCHRRYRRSITINLRENTVDIDGRSRSTYGRIRSISTVDHDQPTGEYGRYRRSIRIHLLKIGSIVDVDRIDRGGRIGRFDRRDLCKFEQNLWVSFPKARKQTLADDFLAAFLRKSCV